MRLKVLEFYQGHGSVRDGYERPFVPGDTVEVDAEQGKYLLEVFPDRFEKVVAKVNKPKAGAGVVSAEE